ncbi:glycosyltransferase family 4 protein [Bradyrhizobium lupini]|uniref:glycosyltransferase family 4 protein n=1 Tax=Rhizobium lupini TaxID=136996 RepID=UPI0034C68931
MTLRILHLVHTPRYSGAETLVSDLCLQHRSLGTDVAVAAFSPAEPAFQKNLRILKEAGVTLFIPARQLGKHERLIHLIRCYGQYRPSVTFAHSVLPALYGRLALAGSNSESRFVTVLHSASNDDFSDAYLRLLERMIWRRADHVVAVSEEGRNSYERRFGCRIPTSVIKNGIDLSQFKPKPQRAVRESMNIRPDQKILLQIGRISPVKQQHASVAALGTLIREGYDATLWLAGLTEDANYEATLREVLARQSLSERVVFLGSRDDVVDLLSAADLFLMPSDQESQGIAFLEALACNVPSLVSNISAFRFAANMANVRIADPHSPDFSIAAKQLLSTGERTPRQLGEFDIRRTSQAYLSLAKALARESALAS